MQLLSLSMIFTFYLFSFGKASKPNLRRHLNNNNNPNEGTPVLRVLESSEENRVIESFAQDDPSGTPLVYDIDGSRQRAPTKVPTKAPAKMPTTVRTKAPVIAPPTKAPVKVVPTKAPVKAPTVKTPTKAPVKTRTTKAPTATRPPTCASFPSPEVCNTKVGCKLIPGQCSGTYVCPAFFGDKTKCQAAKCTYTSQTRVCS